MSGFKLGVPDFGSTSELRKYCTDARNLIRPLSHEIQLSSEELHGALREIPLPDGGGKARQIARAKFVSRHLSRAGSHIDAACVEFVRTYLAFQKHYLRANEQQSRQRRVFDLNS